jgi:hypothetical protein
MFVVFSFLAIETTTVKRRHIDGILRAQQHIGKSSVECFFMQQLLVWAQPRASWCFFE